MSNYQYVRDSMTGETKTDIIKKLTDDPGSFVFIAFREDNVLYQEYLEWLAEGNTPTPADS